MTDPLCTKLNGWGTTTRHLHELRLGSCFTSLGRKGKLVGRSDGRCTVQWATTHHPYNVATGRYRTVHTWGRPEAVAPCMEVER